MSQPISFVKMHALGNDLILVDALHLPALDWSDLARKMTNRHFGIGGDGLLLLLPSETADFRMRMFNPDGTEDMCGNGLRCVAKYLWERGLAKGSEILLETISGERKARLLEGGSLEADMGPPRLKAADLPMKAKLEKVIDYPIKIADKTWKVTCVSMGTPHAVIFAYEETIQEQFENVSPKIERHPLFPERISVDWCQIISPRAMRLRVWERAVGETLTCGTGVCAALVAARLKALVDEEVEVTQPGGSLYVSWRTNGPVILKGPVEKVFSGQWVID